MSFPLLPSNLSWRRSIDISEASMFAVISGDAGETRTPVLVKETTVRGAIGSYNAGYNKDGTPLTGAALETQQNPEKPNVQRIDVAALPCESSVLEVEYSVAFHGANTSPDVCNIKDYGTAATRFISAARTAGIYGELAARYLWNIANARTLWRNGYGTNKVVVVEDLDGGEEFKFDASSLSDTTSFPGLTSLEAACGRTVRPLVDKIASALAGGDMARFRVRTRVRLYPSAEVWPSQEFAEGDNKKRKGQDISRILSSKPIRLDGEMVRQATIHSQKTGNAIRTIDEWHGSEDYGVTPVEAFGWVQRNATAIRRPADDNDAYALLRRIDDIASELDGISDFATALEEGAEVAKAAIYVVAIMVRGGVFTMKSDKKVAPVAPVADEGAKDEKKPARKKGAKDVKAEDAGDEE